MYIETGSVFSSNADCFNCQSRETCLLGWKEEILN